ncbi:MAG: ATP-binding protein [Bacteroidota bacterium]|nr:ATP-binding protein [Bacteroidota bacterium]
MSSPQRQIEDSRLFSSLFDELGEAVLISDKTGKIVRVNRAATRILGMSEGELTSLRHDDEAWQAVFEDGTPVPTTDLPGVRALREGKPISSIEIGILRTDGRLIWILESAAPIMGEGGEISGVIITFPDVTAIVKQRQELRELSAQFQLERDRANKANRLKSAFLATMSHEIRTPMTAILGFSDVLSSELANRVSEQHYTFLRSINISGKRLLNLLNDILDMSKIESGRIDLAEVELDIDAEIEAAVTPLTWIARQKSLDVRVEHHPETLVIEGDRHRFGQVLTNVISNAIKFTRAGSITIRTSLIEEMGSPLATVAIEDTGIGISPDFLPFLFEEFRQEHTGNTKEFGGTGLGLAISRKLVTLMNGTIQVQSEQGKGTVVTLRFPLVAVGRKPAVASQSKAEAVIQPPAEAEEEDTTDEGLVLVVEDNEETQRLLEAYLRGHYRVVCASNAQSVMLAIRKEIPTAILMDVNLPGRDGLAITRDIRAGRLCPNVPIVALTAFAMTGDRERCLEAGCNEYLPKPATRREVLEIVGRVIAEPKTPVA